MGTGAFLAHGHFGSSDAKFYGVELDSITGRISKQLYQKANIQVTGYENALLPDNYFDCVIGNVPFGNFQVNDPQYNRLHFPIHDYFFAKSIDKLRTGGIMAFITSSGTLDKKDDRARKYIAERCDLIGAVRLPNNAFKGSGTKIMTDVIFLQKRDTLRQQDEPWLHLAEDANGITMNRYFVEHPEMICGRIENATVDAATVKEHSAVDADGKDVFCIQLEKKVYYEKEPAGKALLGLLGLALNSEKPVPIGYFKGMELQIQHLPFGNEYHARLAGSGTYSTQLGADVLGNLTRLSNLANGIEPSIEKTRNMQIQLEQQLASAEEEVKRPFPQATELTEKSKRLAVLEGLLNMNDKDIVTDTEPEQQCQTDNRQRGQEER